MEIQTIEAHEEEVRLFDLLDRVERGERIAIVREGVHVATLISADEDRRAKAAAACKRMRERRKGLTLDGLSIREMIEEGRR